MIEKARIKRHILAIMNSPGFRQLSTICIPHRAAILRYHSIQDYPGEFANSIGSGIIHSTSIFEKQMEMVARYCSPVSMNDVLRIARGEMTPPPRAVAVTFDDGFADNFEFAMPLLNRVGVPAAFYTTVGFIDTGRPPWFCRLRYAFASTQRKTWFDSTDNSLHHLVDPQQRKEAFLIASRRCARKAGEAQESILRTIEQELEIDPMPSDTKLMMSWDQVRALRNFGHLVGSHTMTHPNLACVTQEEALRECAESKTRLEQELNTPIVHFSYPSPIMQPHWDQHTVAITAKTGYQCAVTSSSGTVRAGNEPLSLERVTVPQDLQQFEWVIESVFLGRRM